MRKIHFCCNLLAPAVLLHYQGVNLYRHSTVYWWACFLSSVKQSMCCISTNLPSFTSLLLWTHIPTFGESTGEPHSFQPQQSWWRYLGFSQRQVAANALLEGTQGVEDAGGTTRAMFVLAGVMVSFAGAWSFWLIPNTNVAALGPSMWAGPVWTGLPCSHLPSPAVDLLWKTYVIAVIKSVHFQRPP